MQCIGRISKTSGIRHFGDGKHRFYLEYRCDKTPQPNSLCCNRCTNRGIDKIQSSGMYNHGLVTEPIPAHSQMYGGTIYEDWYRLYGRPSDENLDAGEEHMAAARFGLNIVEVPKEMASIVVEAINKEESKEANKEVNKEAIKPAAQVQTKLQFKRTAVPSTVATMVTPSVPLTPAVPLTPLAPAKKPEPKPRAKPKPAVKPIEETPKNIVATHIERDVEEFYADEYEIEHIRLSPFEHNAVRYFREPKKNKLFQQINGSLGDYIGRYDSYTDSIRTDIPDSDDE